MRTPGATPASLAALAITGCGALLAGCGMDAALQREAIAMTLHGGPTATGWQWVVSPWPLDRSVAYLCLDDGVPVGVDQPPPAAVTCAPLALEPASGVLRASFDATRADPGFLEAIEAAEPPWYLTVAGRRGLFSFGMVREVVDSPVPSDPGPS